MQIDKEYIERIMREFYELERVNADLRGTKNALESQVLSLLDRNKALVAACKLAYSSDNIQPRVAVALKQALAQVRK